MDDIFIIVGIFLFYIFISILIVFIGKTKNKIKDASYRIKNFDRISSQYNQLKYEYDKYVSKHGDLEKIEKLLFEKALKQKQDYEEKIKSLSKKHELYLQHTEQNINLLLADKTISMPWLATMVADYYDFVVDETRCVVTNVSGLKKEIIKLKKENKLLEYNIEYFKSLVPELEDNVVDFSEKATDFEYLTKEEFNSLSVGEKNKLALERYKKNRRGKHNIGRDFEMYIGYVLENKGFQVEYFGIEKKLQDLGRDLIAEDDTAIYIIQCKYWSKGKLIHEKHICQLYGTYVKFKLENKTNKKIVPVFVCHNKVSDVAKEFAKELNVQIFENVDIKDYPMIKCNVNTYIYHLPFDQQYDNLLKENCKMVSTVEEAYKLGCRRAYTWRGRV